MKFKVWKERPVKEGTTNLVLIQDLNEVHLRAVRDSGERIVNGMILRIRADGKISRTRGINPILGFPLDNKGRVEFYTLDNKGQKKLDDE